MHLAERAEKAITPGRRWGVRKNLDTRLFKLGSVSEPWRC